MASEVDTGELRSWGAAEEEDDRLIKLVEDVDEGLFDDNDSDWTGFDDEDDFGFGRRHLRDLVCMELLFMFQKKY